MIFNFFLQESQDRDLFYFPLSFRLLVSVVGLNSDSDGLYLLIWLSQISTIPKGSKLYEIYLIVGGWGQWSSSDEEKEKASFTYFLDIVNCQTNIINSYLIHSFLYCLFYPNFSPILIYLLFISIKYSVWHTFLSSLNKLNSQKKIYKKILP